VRQEYELSPILSVGEIFKDMKLTKVERNFVKAAGGHPGTLLWMKTAFSGLSIYLHIYGRYKFSALLNAYVATCMSSHDCLEACRQPVSVALCRIPVSKTKQIIYTYPRTVDDVRTCAFYTYLVPTMDPSLFTPVMAPIQVLQCFVKLDRSKGEALCAAIAPGGTPSPELRFDCFHGLFECYYRMLWIDSNLNRPKKVSLRELYRDTAVFDPIFEDKEVSLYADYRFIEEYPSFFVSDDEFTGDYSF
jgi:hypothetical protein